MKRIITAIVENEPSQIEKVRELCRKYGKEKDVEIDIEEYTNGYDFLEKDTTRFDCVFMDIDMPGINGMETSERLREKNKELAIIFVTNLPQFAINGYKVQALDFIIKPMSYADLSLVLDKIISLSDKRKEDDLFFTIHNEMIRIHPNDILYFEMKNHNVNIHLKNRETISYRETIKELEKKIQGYGFYRCNSGIIVSLDAVDSVKEDVCILSDGTRLQVSRSRRNDFLKAMTDFYFKTGI